MQFCVYALLYLLLLLLLPSSRQGIGLFHSKARDNLLCCLHSRVIGKLRFNLGHSSTVLIRSEWELRTHLTYGILSS
ncbi:hypothetical protein F5X97DRAFT_110793 [Nemania serpens]|nr:hypothetical protein F5X97DRAFT_110793 [Nemania serpens]